MTSTTHFVTIDAECTADRLASILREKGWTHYAGTVQPGAFATVTVGKEDINMVRHLLKDHGIKHGIA